MEARRRGSTISNCKQFKTQKQNYEKKNRFYHTISIYFSPAA